MSSTRNRFTDEQRAILKEYWDKGMKSSGTQEAKKMVQEVMAKTRLEKKQVQNWIKNQKEKKDKEEGVVRERRKPFNVSTITSNATTSRAQLLHRAFRANYLRSKDQSTDEKKKEALKEMAKEWERVKKNEEELKKVEEIVDEEADEQALSSKERMSRVKAITKEITKLCNHLKEEYSYESAFVTARADHGHMATGSTMGIQFLTRNNFEVIRNFTYSVGGRVEGGISNLDDTVRAGLVSSVQMLFNKRYEKVLKKKKQVEYKKIKEGQIKVTTISFPDGLEFKKPGSYSLEDLRRIIQAADEENLKIHFEKTENEREDGPVSDLNSQPEGDDNTVIHQDEAGVDTDEDEAGMDGPNESEDGMNIVIITPEEVAAEVAAGGTDDEGDETAMDIMNNIDSGFYMTVGSEHNVKVPKVNMSVPKIKLTKLNYSKAAGSQKGARKRKGKN